MDILAATQALLRKNRRRVETHQFTVPSHDVYPFQWQWDSAFHAIMLSHFDLSSAKAELLAAVSHPLPSGLLPHMIYWNHDDTPPPNWGRELRGAEIDRAWQAQHSSSITQPPVLAQAALRVYQRAKEIDHDWLRALYNPLLRHFEYLAQERTFNGDSLLYIINPDESGEDNSPRFDEALGLPPQHTEDDNLNARLKLMQHNADCNFAAKACMSQHFGVADVSFNILYAEDLLALAIIARELGEVESASALKARGHRVKQDIVAGLKAGDWFLSYDHIRKTHINVLTWNVFMPLYGGLLSETEARRLVDEYLFNSRYFWTEYGMVTTALTEPAFDPTDGFWRGPIWFAPHWFIYQGLVKYGFLDEAIIIREKTERLLIESGFCEHFNPLSGQGLGAKDFTWGGLFIDMD